MINIDVDNYEGVSRGERVQVGILYNLSELNRKLDLILKTTENSEGALGLAEVESVETPAQEVVPVKRRRVKKDVSSEA